MASNNVTPPYSPVLTSSVPSTVPTTKRDRASTSSPTSSPPFKAPRRYSKLPTTNGCPSPFLELPRELRNLIYSFVYPGALVALGPYRFWVPAGKSYMMGSHIDSSGALSKYLRCYNLPMRCLKEKWYTMMSGPVGIDKKGTQVDGVERSKDVDVAASMSETLVRLRKTTTGGKLPLVHPPSQRQRSGKNSRGRREPGMSEGDSNSTSVASFGTMLPAGETQQPSWAADTALLFVCHQVHSEFAELVYSNSVFAFGSQREALRFATSSVSRSPRRSSSPAFGSFSRPNSEASPPSESILENNDSEMKFFPNLSSKFHIPRRLPVSQVNLSNIRFICLDCRAEGAARLQRPSYTSYQLPTDFTPQANGEMQKRYYKSWTRACSVLATTLTALTDISIFIDIPTTIDANRVGWPATLKLSLSSIWARPWLELARSKSLVRAAVYLCVGMRPHAPWQGYIWVGADEMILHLDVRALECFAEILRRCVLGWDEAKAVREVVERYKLEFPDREGTWKVLEDWNCSLQASEVE